MKKLVVLGAGAVAAASIGLLSVGLASSDPGAANQYNVIGEPYARAVKMLHGMGMSTSFGGSVGSALPQQECMVSSQKMLSNGKMVLNLDCSEKAKALLQEQAPTDAGGPGGRTVGSNGVTTVQATPVGPQPGMSVPPG